MTIAETRFTLATSAVLIVALLPAMAAAQTRKVAPADQARASKHVPIERGLTPASMGIHGFSVVLVLGGTQGTSASDNVPEAARKALADMKDFLPYKRYQLLDAAWILCCGPNTSQVSGRVRGPDARDYLYTVDPGEIVGSRLNLRFTMRQMQDSLTAPVNVEKLSDTARLELVQKQAEAARELDDAERQVRTIRQRYEVGTATPSEMESATTRARLAQLYVQDLQRMAVGGQNRGAAQAGGTGRGGGGSRGAVPIGARDIMDSSFSISPGETVVIGTSRLNGDQALIAILTAATKPGASR